MSIKTRTGTPLGDDGQIGLENTPDEEENAVVAQRLENCDLVSEGLRLRGSWVLHVQELDGYCAVVEVATLMHDSERARANFFVHVDLYLREWDLP